MTANKFVSRRDVLSQTLGLGASAFVLPAAAAQLGVRSKDVVLYVTLALGNPFYQEMIGGLKQGLSEAPTWTLDAQAGQREDDASGQRQIMETFLAESASGTALKLRGLVLVPSNTRVELTEAIRKYNAARIPVINVDIPIDKDALAKSDARVATFIGSNNLLGGAAAAEGMATALPTGGKILILVGPPGNSNARDRRDGFRKRLSELAAARSVKYEFREWVADFNKSEALTDTMTVLASSDGLDGIFAENDLMALGAVQAIETGSFGHRVRPKVIGYDAIPEARKAVREGRMYATVSQNPDVMGRRAIQRLLAIHRGETIPSEEIIPVSLVQR